MKPFTLIALAAFVLVVPGAALAATYAYVNTAGEVMTTESATPNGAIMTAPGIAARSGVMLITNDNDPVLGGSGDADDDRSEDTSSNDQDEAADDLRDGLRTLLSEHVSYSLDVMRAIADDEEDMNDDSEMALEDALDDQDQNAEDLGDAIESVYGADAGASFTEMFKEHITSSNDYARAIAEGDDEAADEALEELNEYLEEISAFLAGANPNIDEDDLLAALSEHEDLLNEAIEAYVDGNEDESDDLEDDAVEQVRGAADYLADAIIAQFPDKF